jgi:hypothetical protein
MALALRAGTLQYRIAELTWSTILGIASTLRFNKIRSINRISIRAFSYLWEKKSFCTFLDFSAVRKFVDSCQFPSPLISNTKTQISVVIPCHPKDSALMSFVLSGLEKNCLNQITEIIIVSPSILPITLKSKLNLRILQDSDVLDPKLVTTIKSIFPSSQFGWVVQQVLKIRCALQYSLNENILIMDSDTVLIKPTLFVFDKYQTLSITREYHRQYVKQYQNFSNSNFDTGFSYVTHYQLWQRDILETLWGDDRLNDWLNAADLSSNSSISEYHSYGSHLIQNFPDRFNYSEWGNAEMSRSLAEDLDYESISQAFPNARSVSIHSYS